MSKSEMARLEHQCNRLFVYGILKRGYELDLSQKGCKFLGEAQLPGANLYGMGYKDANKKWTGVGLRFVEDPYRVAFGEVFEIPEAYIKTWQWLDFIEQNGFCYTRKIVPVCILPETVEEGGVVIEMRKAWVYEHTFPGTKYNESNLIESGRF